MITSTNECEVVGVNPVELALVSGEKPWIAGERQAVVTTMEKFIFGGMEIQGLGRVDVCAEFVAAAIYVVVHPANALRACKWLEG